LITAIHAATEPPFKGRREIFYSADKTVSCYLALQYTLCVDSNTSHYGSRSGAMEKL
jgi:hypothetical protein